jgi:hypothetical protein
VYFRQPLERDCNHPQSLLLLLLLLLPLQWIRNLQHFLPVLQNLASTIEMKIFDFELKIQCILYHKKKVKRKRNMTIRRNFIPEL